MSKENYYIYLKTDSNNKHFEAGITTNIIQTLLEQKQRNIMIAETSNNDAIVCWKLIYYEYGLDEATAHSRCARINKLAPSKRAALIDRNNPSWRDLSIHWLRR